MAKLLFCLLAENVITDSSENKVTIINVIERLNAPSFPAIHPLLYFYSMWKKELSLEEVESFSISLDILYKYVDGSTSKKEKGPLQIEIPSGKDKVRAIIRIEGIPVEQPGELFFQLKKLEGNTWKEVGEYPIDIKSQVI